MRRFSRHRGFSLAEALIAISLVAMTLGMLALLFQRSFHVLKIIDDKELARQAGRMGLDRITSELREAVEEPLLGSVVEFEKIRPGAEISEPPAVPTPLPNDFTAPEWEPNDAYPPSERLLVRYSTADEKLFREVRLKSSGTWVKQVVVVGINSFFCKKNPESPSEIEVMVSILDGGKIVSLSNRVFLPCIKEKFQ